MEKDKIMKALILAEREFEPVIFDMVNPHFKSKFASLRSMKASTMPALHKYGIIPLQPWDYTAEGNVILSTQLWHDSGQFIESKCLIIMTGKTDQQFGSSIYYKRRYQYGSLLNLVGEEEDDGEMGEGRPSKSQDAYKAPKPGPSPITEWKPKQAAAKPEPQLIDKLEDIVLERVGTAMGLYDFVKLKADESKKTKSPGDFGKVVEAALSREELTAKFCDLYRQWMGIGDKAIDE
jgi:hypothetical protein